MSLFGQGTPFQLQPASQPAYARGQPNQQQNYIQQCYKSQGNGGGNRGRGGFGRGRGGPDNFQIESNQPRQQRPPQPNSSGNNNYQGNNYGGNGNKFQQSNQGVRQISYQGDQQSNNNFQQQNPQNQFQQNSGPRYGGNQNNPRPPRPQVPGQQYQLFGINVSGKSGQGSAFQQQPQPAQQNIFSQTQNLFGQPQSQNPQSSNGFAASQGLGAVGGNGNLFANTAPPFSQQPNLFGPSNPPQQNLNINPGGMFNGLSQPQLNQAQNNDDMQADHPQLNLGGGNVGFSQQPQQVSQIQPSQPQSQVIQPNVQPLIAGSAPFQGFGGGQQQSIFAQNIQPQAQQPLSLGQMNQQKLPAQAQFGFGGSQNNNSSQPQFSQIGGGNQMQGGSIQASIKDGAIKLIVLSEQQIGQTGKNNCEFTVDKNNTKDGPFADFGFFSIANNHIYLPNDTEGNQNLECLPRREDCF